MSTGDDQGQSSDVGVVRSAVRDRAAMFGATKPAVSNRPGKSVLNRFPAATASSDPTDTGRLTPGAGFRGVSKFQTSTSTSQSQDKKPPPTFNKTSPNTFNKSPPSVGNKSTPFSNSSASPADKSMPVSNTSDSPVNNVTPVSKHSTPPVADKPKPSVTNKPALHVIEKTPPAFGNKTTTPGLPNKKVWTPPKRTPDSSTAIEDHNHNVKGVADTNRFQRKSSDSGSDRSSTYSGGKTRTSTSSFQKSDTSTDSDNLKSSSDGSVKDLDKDKTDSQSESSEILSNIRSQLRATKAKTQTTELGKDYLPSSRQRVPGEVTPPVTRVGTSAAEHSRPTPEGSEEKADSTASSTKPSSPEILRKKSTKKRISVLATIKSRVIDNKQFKLISKGTLISSHDAPPKPRRLPDVDINKIVQEYQDAVKDFLDEDEDLYDDVESFARGSCLANRISYIPDMTEEEEFGSDQTGSGSGSASMSGSGGGFKLIQDDSAVVVEGEMEDVYEEFNDDTPDSAAVADQKEKEKAEKEKEKERLKREKEEKKKKEAARKEQEKKEKAEKAEKARQEKERLAKEKKEKERKEKEEKEKEKRKKLKSESADDTSTKGSTAEGEGAPMEEEYDDCSAMVDGIMEEEYADVDELVSSSSTSSLQTTEKTKREKDEKEEKKKKDAARKEEERKKKEKQKEEKERLAKEKKERDRKEKEERELKKKFKLTGNEEKVSSGVVLDDVKGGKLDLAVGKGDLVDIMRMDNNPTGKFLVKSEDNRWGYMESSNIRIDTESIKEVIKKL